MTKGAKLQICNYLQTWRMTPEGECTGRWFEGGTKDGERSEFIFILSANRQ